MFTGFFPGAEGASGHWAVVVGVAVAFLALQLALSLRLYLRARRQDRMLRRLLQDLEFGGDGRRDLDELPWGFAWLDWAMSVFPSGAGAPPANFSRDEALKELDTRIASDSSYLLLQRMGVMAPLLGVVLTVVGFYWLNVDETGEQSLQTILIAVTPLVSGVGAGAVLALINQGLLQVVGARMERLRMSARTWFDAAIWRHVAPAKGATDSAVAAVERFARELAESATRHSAGASHIETSTASLKLAASQFEQVVRNFHNEIKGIPQALNVLRDSMATSATALQELIPIGARSVANLDVSVAAFRTTIDREFTDAARLHFQASKSLAGSLEQISESTRSLKLGAEAMQHAAETSVASSNNANESLSEVSQELAGASQTLVELKQAIESLQKFSDSRADIDRLAETLSRSAEIAEAISSLPDQLRGLVERNAAENAAHAAARGKSWLGVRPR